MRDKGGARRINMSQGSRPCTGDCGAMWIGLEVTIVVTIHDRMFDLRQKGVGEGHLRHELRAIFGTIYCQESIDGLELGGTVKFVFKRRYKTLGASHEETLVHLRFE